MSFFPVECEIFGLADFFQNLIVSRASVNGGRQKGPRLAQSFSTEVAIESGLYIAPGTQVWQVRHQKIDFPTDLAKPASLARFCPTGCDWSGQPSGSDLPNWQVWQVWARIGAKPRFWPDPWSEPGIAKIAKISTFREKSDFCRFCGFQDLTWSVHISDPECYMTALWVRMCMRNLTIRTGSRNMHVRYMLATMYTRKSCQRQTLACVHFWKNTHSFATNVQFWTFVRFENNFWNKSPVWDAFPRFVLVVALFMFESPSFLPHNTSDSYANGYAEPSSGRAYAVRILTPLGWDHAYVLRLSTDHCWRRQSSEGGWC